jgi:hypothetical protein
MTGGDNDWTYHDCPFCGQTVGRLPNHLQNCEEAGHIGHSESSQTTSTPAGGQR